MATLVPLGIENALQTLSSSQSYLSGVVGSVAHCSGDLNVDKFTLLAASFDRGAFNSEYDLWTYTDTYRQSEMYKSLSASYKAKIAGPKGGALPAGSNVSSVADVPALRLPSQAKRYRQRGRISSSRSSSVVGGLTEGSSKN